MSDNTKKEDNVTPLEDLEDEDFLEAPAMLIDENDLIKAADVDTALSPSYKRCNNCALRNAEPPCAYFEHGGVCQIERNLFRGYLQDMKNRGVDINDRISVMLGFIHWVNVWRAYAIESSKNESFLHETKEGSELSKFRHKIMNDHTKNFFLVIRELEATKKAQSKKKDKKKKDDLATILSAP